MFYHLLNEVLSEHAPVKLKRVKRHSQPGWFNEEIKCAILERNRLHKQKEFMHYKIMRNKVTCLIKKSKKSFYNKAIKENKNTAELWKTLKDIQSSGNSAKGGIILPKSLSHCHKQIQGEENILNALNEHFVNISDMINASFAPCGVCSLSNHPKLLFFWVLLILYSSKRLFSSSSISLTGSKIFFLFFELRLLVILVF